MKKIVGRFERMGDADRTVQSLLANGVPSSEIVTETRHVDNAFAEYGGEGASPTAFAVGMAACFGTFVGLILGLLAGTGFLGIKGVPPAGTLATMAAMTLAGMAAGAALLGMFGLLFGIGASLLRYFDQASSRGGTLVSVLVGDGQESTATSVMRQHNVAEIQMFS